MNKHDISGIRAFGASMCALVLLLGSVAALAQEVVVPQWAIGSPVLLPGPAGSFDEIAVKDPSVVFHGGAWHVFYTAGSRTEFTTGYVSAAKWSELQVADPGHHPGRAQGALRHVAMAPGHHGKDSLTRAAARPSNESMWTSRPER
jgi:hypothetical protein